ncbi:MAG: Na/Pi cotransporter family protein, partial [Clostridia bacterium]|nr:Na/Pi cotransporter family protein [Clostridia bacterium]
KKETTKLLHMIGDFERISDHAVNIAESAEEMHDKKITFSESAQKELKVLVSAVLEITDITYRAVNEDDYALAATVEPLEQVIDTLRDSIKKRHIIRLQNSECTIEHGFILSDILNNLERVADHCSNIAGCYIEMSKHNALDLHKYLKDYRDKEEHFDTLFNEFSKKYTLE